MGTRAYKFLSQYDKENNLIKYVEFTDDFKFVKRSYAVFGNKVERRLLQDFRADDEPSINIFNSIIEYNDNVNLFPLTFDGETYLETKLSGSSNSFEIPKIVNTFSSSQSNHEDFAFVDTFSIDLNLINDYLNKL